MMSNFKSKEVIWWSIFILVAGCFAFILIVFPKAYDDWWYWGETLHYGTDINGHHSLWMGVQESFKYHWNNDNVRLGNIISSALLHVPKWIPGLICGICFALALWLMTKISCIKPREIAKLVLLCILIVLPNIWQEAMFSQDYAFNYICVLPLFLGSIWLFIRDKKISWGWMFILGILLGGWHEGFGLTVFGGGILILITKKLPINRNRIVLFIGIFLGFLWLVIPPAMWNRLDGENKSFLITRSIYLFLIFIFILIWVISLTIKKFRKIALSPLAIFTITSGIGLLPIVILTSYIRAAYPAIILSACCIVLYVSVLMPIFSTDRNIFSWIFSVSGIIVLGTHLLAVCHETIIIRRVIDKANHELIMNHDKEVVFSEMRYPWESSPFTLGRPDINIFNPHDYHFRFMNYFNMNFKQMIVPTALKDFESYYGETIPGGTECRLWNGYIVSPNLNDTIHSWAKIQYGPIKVVSPLEKIIFQNNKGEKYVYLVPDRPIYAIYAGKPVSLDFNVKF